MELIDLLRQLEIMVEEAPSKTFSHKIVLDRDEILDLINRYMIFDYFGVNEEVRKKHSHCANVNGKSTYARILIKKIQQG